MTGHENGHDRDPVTTLRTRPDTADTRGGQQVDTPDTPTGATHGRVVSWAGFIFGSVTSIAANVLHAWLPADSMPPGWTPGIAPQIGAAIWPIGLLLSVEVLSRARWRRGRLWRLARYGGAGTVAFGSAIISYGHVRDVLLAWGYGPMGASVGPLTLDGLMVVSGFALLSITTATTNTATAINAEETANDVAALEVSVPSGAPPVLSGHTQASVPVSGTSDHAVATSPDIEDNDADTRRCTARELRERGWSHGRIAAELQVSKRTVRRYLSGQADTDHAPVPALSAPIVSEPHNAVSLPPGPINTNHHPMEGALA